MSHFNESLYLRKEIQRLHEENTKLKRYLYEMQIQQDAGSLMVPEVSTTPDTYVPDLKQDNTRTMMQDPMDPNEDDLKLLRNLSAKDLNRLIRRMYESRDEKERKKAIRYLEWLKSNRREAFDQLDDDLRELVPDVTIP